MTPIQAAQQAGLPTLEARLRQLGATAPRVAPAGPARSWFTRLFAALGRFTAG